MYFSKGFSIGEASKYIRLDSSFHFCIELTTKGPLVSGTVSFLTLSTTFTLISSNNVTDGNNLRNIGM